MKKSASQASTKLKNPNKNQKEIRFYRANEKPYGAFSNLFRCPIRFEERIFPTAEHAYQFGKPRKNEVREWILSAPSPSLVAMAAHGLYTWDIVPNWSALKFDRMRLVLKAKFSQHDDLRRLLLSTGDARLVEVGRVNSIVNRTWGEVNGRGQNKLGNLLMELREKFRGEEARKKLKGNKGDQRNHSTPKKNVILRSSLAKKVTVSSK